MTKEFLNSILVNLNYSNIEVTEVSTKKVVSYHKLNYFGINRANKNICFSTIEADISLTKNEVKNLIEKGYHNGRQYKIYVTKKGGKTDNRNIDISGKQKVVGFHISDDFNLMDVNRLSDEKIYDLALKDNNSIIIENPKIFFNLLNNESIDTENMYWFILNL